MLLVVVIGGGRGGAAAAVSGHLVTDTFGYRPYIEDRCTPRNRYIEVHRGT